MQHGDASAPEGGTRTTAAKAGPHVRTDTQSHELKTVQVEMLRGVLGPIHLHSSLASSHALEYATSRLPGQFVRGLREHGTCAAPLGARKALAEPNWRQAASSRRAGGRTASKPAQMELSAQGGWNLPDVSRKYLLGIDLQKWGMITLRRK